jgi:hypothetical protein
MDQRHAHDSRRWRRRPDIVPDFDDDAVAAPFGNPSFHHAADRQPLASADRFHEGHRHLASFDQPPDRSEFFPARQIVIWSCRSSSDRADDIAHSRSQVDRTSLCELLHGSAHGHELWRPGAYFVWPRCRLTAAERCSLPFGLAACMWFKYAS